MKVALISCTKLKQTYACSAYEMYQPSPLFRKAFTYIDGQDYDEIYILSAKHGLLTLGVYIEPYDETLNNASAEEIRIWSYNVSLQINNCFGIKEVDFYAGDKYRKYLIPLLERIGIKCEVPLKGLGIGEQLQFYTKQGGIICGYTWGRIMIG